MGTSLEWKGMISMNSDTAGYNKTNTKQEYRRDGEGLSTGKLLFVRVFEGIRCSDKSSIVLPQRARYSIIPTGELTTLKTA